MPNFEVTVHVADLEEVKAILNCAVKLVEAIKECNVNDFYGTPYRELVSAIKDLEAVKNNRS